LPKNLKTEPYHKAFADRRRDPDGKREAILRTAVALFHDRGYTHSSMNEIAQRLQITKPALYHYFRNKEDILLECYRWGCILIREFLDEIAARGGSGMEKVEDFIHAYIDLISSDFGRAVIRLDDSELSAPARSEVRNYKREIDRRLRLFVREGMDDGSIIDCDPKLTSFAIAGAINWLSMWYRPGGALSPSDIASSFVQTFAGGLRRTAAQVAPLRMPAAGQRKQPGR
jgi:AcrR family transcriptional regulator